LKYSSRFRKIFCDPSFIRYYKKATVFIRQWLSSGS